MSQIVAAILGARIPLPHQRGRPHAHGRGSTTDVWQPGREGEAGRRSRYQLDIFSDSYSVITPGVAQQLAPDADLYAEAAPLPPGAPVPGSGAHERARRRR